ncbi:MAG: hypothetical protein HY042_04355 [Spirochaetia bacterium]|nr:hypothetical protein [Spirochaetia bacterium]
MSLQNNRMAAISLGLLAFMATSQLSAGTYTLFVHGKGTNACSITSNDAAGKWTHTDTYGAASKTRSSGAYVPRFVNYYSEEDPRTSGTCRAQTQVYNAIKTYCYDNGNRCSIICHSAGCYAMDYYFATNTAARNINWVVFAGAATGGSELANLTAGPLPNNNMTAALRTSNARSFNHNLSPVSLYQTAGYKGAAWSFALPGEDDDAVAFHSACGQNSTGSWTVCNATGKWTRHVAYCNSKGALTCNTSKYAYYGDHSTMQNVGRDALDRLLGYL